MTSGLQSKYHSIAAGNTVASVHSNDFASVCLTNIRSTRQLLEHWQRMIG